MEESLRLAYLSAMDIPVWALRVAGDEEGDEATVVEPAAQKRAPPAGRTEDTAMVRRPRDLLEPEPPARATVRREEPLRAPPTQAVAPGAVVALLLASAGKTLFIDSAPPAAQGPQAVALYSAIALALDGERVNARAQAFSWPPSGTAFEPAQARDAVLGLFSKLQQEERFERVVLMGEAACALLLGWDTAAFAARERKQLSAEGIAVALLVTHSAARLLSEPLLKREAWLDLRIALGT